MRPDSVDQYPAVDCSYTKVIACRVGALGASVVRAAKPGDFAHAKRGRRPRFDSSFAAAERGYIPRFPLGKPREFTLEELGMATCYFSSERVIGRGGCGKVYRGILSDGTIVAVKVIDNHFEPYLEQFQSELTASSAILSVSHPNLVPAIGYHFSSEGKAAVIVSPFMANGDVSRYLGHREPSSLTPLDWPTRKRIALGVAKGISRLHSLGIIHLDIKPSNVMLDEDFNAHVGDFGLAKAIGLPCDGCNAPGIHGGEDCPHGYTTRLCGTFGYMAPEFCCQSHCSRELDVYAFGVTLIQLVTGMPYLFGPQGDVRRRHLVLRVEQLFRFEEDLTMHVHPSLLGMYDESEAIELIRLGLVCAQRDPKKRPDMQEVIAMMEGSSAHLKQRWDSYDYPWTSFQPLADQRSETDSFFSSTYTTVTHGTGGSGRGDDDEEVLSAVEFYINEEEPEENGIDGHELRQADDFSSEESNKEHWTGLTGSANSRSLENDALAELVEVDPDGTGNPKQSDEVTTKLKEVMDQMREMELSHQAAMEEMYQKQISIMQSMIQMQERHIQRVNELQPRVDQLREEALLYAMN